MKVSQKQSIENVAFSAGAAVGAVGSRMVTDKLTTTLKSSAVRYGLLGTVGIAIAAFVGPKDNATEFAQSTDVDIAATQLTATLEAVMTEDGRKTMEERIMETALGNPGIEIVYVDNTPPLDYYPYEEVSATITVQPTIFLSVPSQFAEV